MFALEALPGLVPASAPLPSPLPLLSGRCCKEVTGIIDRGSGEERRVRVSRLCSWGVWGDVGVWGGCLLSPMVCLSHPPADSQDCQRKREGAADGKIVELAQ